MKLLLMLCTMIGLTTFSIVAFGSIPPHGRITDDTAIYQNLSEIRVPRQAKPDFDSDIARLSALEPQYREKLPSVKESRVQEPRLQEPMRRISKRKYRYSAKKSRSS